MSTTNELSSLSLASITANSFPSLSYEWMAIPRFSLGCLNHWETNFFSSIWTQTPFFALTSIFFALTFRPKKEFLFFIHLFWETKRFLKLLFKTCLRKWWKTTEKYCNFKRVLLGLHVKELANRFRFPV